MQTHWKMFAAGLMAGVLLTTFVQAFAAGRTVSAEQKAAAAAPAPKIVLENARVRVRDVTFPPGVSAGMHTHDLAHVGVILTQGALVFTEAGKSETTSFDAGSVGFRAANVTHQVANPGKVPMRVIEVELKSSH